VNRGYPKSTYASSQRSDVDSECYYELLKKHENQTELQAYALVRRTLVLGIGGRGRPLEGQSIFQQTCILEERF